MERLLQDVRYALRALARTPAFTLTAVLTLSLGVGVSTTLFGAADALLLRPLPLRAPERLVEITPEVRGARFVTRFAYPQFEVLRDRTRQLAGLAAVTRMQISLRDRGPAKIVPGEIVSANYFDVLGVSPALGRFFVGEEDEIGGPRSLVLSHATWRDRYGADPAVLGRTVLLNGEPFTVVGVAPRGFTTAHVGTAAPAVWVPMGSYPVFGSEEHLRGARYMLELVGRLRDGVSPAAARAELDAILVEYSRVQQFGIVGVTMDRVTLRPLDPVEETLKDGMLNHLRLLGLATTLLLLIAGINVAGMLLARSLARGPEIGIRMAIGASRARVVRQLLTEGTVLFLLGGTGGALIALWLTEALAAFPWPVPVQTEFSMDGRALAFALGLALVTGVGCGIAPALQATRATSLPTSRIAWGGTGHPRSRLRGGLVVLQISLSLLFLVGGGLFARALQRAWSIDPGFDSNGVAVTSLELSLHGYDRPGARAFGEQMLERARQVPGVVAASFATEPPFGSDHAMQAIRPEGVEIPPGAPFIMATFVGVTADYFRTLRIPILQGRGLTDGDGGAGSRVAVINRAMAERFWPGQDPIGKRLDEGENPAVVVGVVGNTRGESLRAPPGPIMYVPFFAEQPTGLTLHVRTRGDPAPVFAALRREAAALDPSLPPLAFTPLSAAIGLSLLPQRVGAWLAGAFGLFGLLLAALGLYGVMTHSIVRRTREIGVRVALGAGSRDVTRLVLRQGMALTALGCTIGVAAAVGATRLIAGLLYGVSPFDPPAFAVALLLLGAVALMAVYLPARRASRMDPMTALRAE